jgi:ATP phosphoribosyltransferase regulatory subunit
MPNNFIPTQESLLPKGVKDFLPLKAVKIDYLNRALAEVFQRWGFRPVVPPSLENLDVLENGLGAGLRERTFRFDDRQSGKLVAFPPDITPQIARIFATRMQDLPLPLRLCYSGRVLRHAEQQAGKDREIFQAGVELIGLESAEADAEMITMTIESLQAIGAREFTVDIGQVEFFNGIMAELDLPAAALQQLREAIVRKDNSELKSLLEALPINDRSKEELQILPRLFGGREILDKAASTVRNPRSQAALDNLAQVLDVLDIHAIANHLTLDLAEIRSLDYHTGITFQGFLPGLGRAVCSGGRYDNLTARYGRQAPATGFTFNLLNLLFALDRELESQVENRIDVLLFQAGADKKPAQRIARALRNQGYSAARDMLPRDLETSLAYAGKMNFTYLMIISEDDQPLRLIRVADRQERTLTLADIVAEEFILNPAGDK